MSREAPFLYRRETSPVFQRLGNDPPEKEKLINLATTGAKTVAVAHVHTLYAIAAEALTVMIRFSALLPISAPLRMCFC